MKQLYVPKRIKAGYNEREDTYSGKLAYIIYWDDKGKLRKENSWRGWMEEELGEDDFDNVPTSGFVLNRAVGGVKRSWSRDARIEKVRVFDPRGFEIEIDMDNLLFILQENSSIVGKGLEGEFVYAWDGKNIVLLPTNCTEYEKSKEYTSLQSKKVTRADMVAGCQYKTKKGQNVIYLGRFDYMDYYDGQKKKHIFVNADHQPEPPEDAPESVWEAWEENDFASGPRFIPEAGFTKLAIKVSDEPVGNLAELIEEFSKTANASMPTHIEWEIVDELPEFPPFEDSEDNYKRMQIINERCEGFFITRRKDVWIDVRFDENWDGYSYDLKRYTNFKGYSLNEGYEWTWDSDNKYPVSKYIYGSERNTYDRESLEGMTFYRVYVVLESGSRIPMNKYQSYLRGW